MDGKKLSKRHGATAVGDYQHHGLLPSAMLNFLALLGWSPGGDREIMTVAEMIELFTPDGLQKKAAIFDPQKLDWMNGQHLSMIPLDELEPIVRPAILAAGLTDEATLAAKREWYLALLDLLRVRARTIDDIVRQAGPYFLDHIEYDPEAVAKQWKNADEATGILEQIAQTLEAAPSWQTEPLESALRSLAESRGIAAGKLFQPLRVALTGLTVSPGIFEVLMVMGRDLALARIADAVTWLKAKGFGAK
jgi:glutamyl-tRNA synthetase